MKIVMIGPGLTPIPPKEPKAFACEALIWDYYTILNSIKGVVCKIVNTVSQNEMLKAIKEYNPDVVHIMYDDHIGLVKKLPKNKYKVLYTTHFAYITQYNKYKGQHYEKNILKPMLEVKDSIYIFAISEEIRQFYIKMGVKPERVFTINNGANSSLIKYTKTPSKSEKSMCLGRIEDRKRQYLHQDNESIEFVGNKVSSKFDTSRKNYLGGWNRDKVYENLTEYGNLVHFADGEADPLVVKEGLMAGLSIVISEVSCANVDTSLPFIDVIPESKITDKTYVNNVINHNRRMNLLFRDHIRKYAEEKFSWDYIIKNKYLKKINELK